MSRQIEEIIRFPVRKKRGAKVKRGPCAQILSFPAPLTGTELRAEWFWLRNMHDRWDHEQLPTPDDLAAFDEARFDKAMETDRIVRSAFEKAPLTESEMRQDVTKWRAHIERRVQVKDWLEQLGVDWKKVLNPEQALFFAFDRMHECELPTGA